VPQRPQRPFIPHRTPKASRQITARSEFRLTRPFVPGSSPEEAEAAPMDPPVEIHAVESPPAISPTPQRPERERLPSIEVFLTDEVSAGDEESNELPPVEHFLDPLPAVGSFAPDAEGALMEESTVAVDLASPGPTSRPETESGWLMDDWQQYDWRAAATLGEGAESQASNEWATTDWGAGKPTASDKPSAAQALATALDQIAQRIREGDLSVPPPGALTDPAAIAATLAALLGVKR
jgi:hypothetical protein